MKSTGKLSCWILALAFAVTAIVFGANAGTLLVIDDPQPSDVMVVLAGETYFRPERALQLFNQGYARRVLLDVSAGSRVFGFTELQLAEKYVHDLPQSASIEICPIEGLSTKDESHDVEKCLAREPATKILLVTSDFHTRRSLSIFRHELPGKSFSVAAVRDPTQFGTHWWAHRQWAKTCVDEWLRIVWWTAVDRWH